ncbi:MAG: DUF3465 domain-containing protein [Neisseria sp.]|uniref:DUF3465 domain-containing protein n=1 Tax=Neisseria sp. TaxID=192066 RepID=UPI0026DB9A69|nr:DUF3465 domain-containing protein [Neisseria sp.]MDO4640236.1 DUF3465 domain-containing protein [Neisseria sp.]
MNKNKLIILIVAIITAFGWQYSDKLIKQSKNHETITASSDATDNSQIDDDTKTAAFEQKLKEAHQNNQSNLQIEGKGIVSKVLLDDNKGSRHQRFIIRLNNGQTILIAHNIDLAQKIKNLRKGDTVKFYGEYEWSKQGGVIHWTHKDPSQKHTDGWLEHQGQIYQ